MSLHHGYTWGEGTNGTNERQTAGLMCGRKKRWELVKQKVGMHKEGLSENETKSNKKITGNRETEY